MNFKPVVLTVFFGGFLLLCDITLHSDLLGIPEALPTLFFETRFLSGSGLSE